MSELRESLSPESRQIQLISVYRSIPARTVAADRMSRAIGGENTSLLPKEQAEYLSEKAGRAGVDHSNSAELLILKRELLIKLISEANITNTSKDIIFDSFNACFAFGGDASWDIFSTLGVTDGSRKEAGIFSTDPETRKGIERDIYKEQVITLQDLINDKTEGETDEHIIKQRELLQDFEQQFMGFYGEPISKSPTD